MLQCPLPQHRPGRAAIRWRAHRARHKLHHLAGEQAGRVSCPQAPQPLVVVSKTGCEHECLDYGCGDSHTCVQHVRQCARLFGGTDLGARVQELCPHHGVQEVALGQQWGDRGARVVWLEPRVLHDLGLMSGITGEMW